VGSDLVVADEAKDEGDPGALNFFKVPLEFGACPGDCREQHPGARGEVTDELRMELAKGHFWVAHTIGELRMGCSSSARLALKSSKSSATEKKHFALESVVKWCLFRPVNLKRLVETARQALAEAGLDRLRDGRTNQHLDERVVRFLRQAGVVSPPAGHGPGAVWGGLHHEQILACRALQMAGATLAEVAESLRGRDEEALRELRARVMATLRAPENPEPARTCPSWRIGEDFILVSQSGRNVPSAILIEFEKLLYSR
jgi:hypothetical protein